MGLFKKDTWKWKLRLLNPSDFELDLIFTAKNSLFMKIYNLTVVRMKRAHDVHIKGRPEIIEAFEIDPRFFGLLRNYVKKPFSISRVDVEKAEKVLLIKYDVVRSNFQKVGEDWFINVTLAGVYADKRR